MLAAIGGQGPQAAQGPKQVTWLMLWCLLLQMGGKGGCWSAAAAHRGARSVWLGGRCCWKPPSLMGHRLRSVKPMSHKEMQQPCIVCNSAARVLLQLHGLVVIVVPVT